MLVFTFKFKKKLKMKTLKDEWTKQHAFYSPCVTSVQNPNALLKSGNMQHHYEKSYL